MNSTIMIAAGMLLTIALIVWALTMSARKDAAKKKALMMGRLKQMAREHDCTIGPTDNMGTKVIALDNIKGKIFYVDQTGVVAQSEVIDIADVKACELIQSGNRQVAVAKNGREKIEDNINRIHLEVNKKNGDNVALLFYDETRDGVLEMLGLREKALKWQRIIKN